MENIENQVNKPSLINYSRVKLSVKLVFWLVMLLLFSLYHWRYIDYVLNIITPESFRFDLDPFALVNFVVLVVWVGLGFILFPKSYWALAMMIVIILPFLLFFGLDWTNFIGIGLAVGLLLNAESNVIEELKNRIKLSSRGIIRRGISQIVLAIFLLISFAAYQSPVAQSLQKINELPSASADFIRNIVDATVSAFSEVEDPALKEIVVNEVANQTTTSLNKILEPYFKYTPPLLAFTLFLVLWGLSWIFILMATWLGMLVFFVLKKAGFVQIQEYDVKAEKLIV